MVSLTVSAALTGWPQANQAISSDASNPKDHWPGSPERPCCILFMLFLLLDWVLASVIASETGCRYQHTFCFSWPAAAGSRSRTGS